MQIVFYNNTAEMERVDKTNYLNKNFEIFGYLKNSTSIVNPTIIVELKRDVVSQLVADDNNSLVKDDENKNIVFLEKLLKSNYCYISDFNRYYYIKDIVSINNNLWEIYMNVDVLMSFKEYILNNEGLIERCEEYPPLAEKNYNLIDNNFTFIDSYDEDEYTFETDFFNIVEGDYSIRYTLQCSALEYIKMEG